MATAVKKPPATITSSISLSSSSTSTRNDLKACLEILKRLAPRVTPDLPSLNHHNHNDTTIPTSISHLNTNSPSNNNVTSSTIAATSSKRKSQAGRDGDGEEGEDEEQDTRITTTVKRRKKSTSTLEETTSSPSISDNAKLGDHTSSVDPNATITTKTTSTAIPKLPNFKTLASSSSNKHKRSGSTSSVASQSQQQPSSSSRISSGQVENNKDRSSSSKSASSAVIPAPLNLSGQRSNAISGSAANSAHSPPPLPSPAISVTTSNNNHSKSNHTRNASTVSLSNSNAYIAPSPLSPNLISPPSGIWTKDRFKRIAAICREKGRALKHAGDKRMREYSSSSNSNSANTNSKSAGGVASRHAIPVLALLEQLDAVILYAYAFWCEDQAAGYARTRQTSSASNASSSATSTSSSTSTLTSIDLRSNASNENQSSINSNNLNASTSSNLSSTSFNGNGNGQSTNTTWKPGCIAENWKSIFGLVAFVRGRAEKMSLNPPSARSSPRLAEGLPRAMELVVAWLNMLEALILQHLTTNSSRHLNSQANRLLGAINSSSGNSTMGLSPPGGDNESTISSDVSSTGGASTISSSPETSNFLQSFLKLQSDLEKIHTLWPTSQNILLHPEQSSVRGNNHHQSKTSSDSPNSSSSSTADDILSIVIRKGKMAYDLEPTKLDDFVIPNLPRDGIDVHGTFGFDDLNHNDASMTTTIGNGPKSPEDLFKDEENYFRFSWPVVLHHRNAVAHTTSFGRALLYEISERLRIDYKSPDIEPPQD